MFDGFSLLGEPLLGDASVALTLQSAVRANPAPCQHFVVTLNVDGVRTITVELAAGTLDDPVTDDDLQALLKLWGRYQRSKGKTLAQMIGGTLFAELP